MTSDAQREAEEALAELYGQFPGERRPCPGAPSFDEVMAERPPIVEGGQGRTGADLAADASALVWMWVLVLAFAGACAVISCAT